MERPIWKYKRNAKGEWYASHIYFPGLSVVKLHYRILDFDNTDDPDDFFKVDIRLQADPAFTDYISPTEEQRWKYRHAASQRAKAIVANIDLYKRNAEWRRRLKRAAYDLEWVWEPYRQARLEAFDKHGKEWPKVLLRERRRERRRNYLIPNGERRFFFRMSRVEGRWHFRREERT